MAALAAADLKGDGERLERAQDRVLLHEQLLLLGDDGLDALRAHLLLLVRKLGREALALLLTDRKSTRLNSSHITRSRMPSSA